MNTTAIKLQSTQPVIRGMAHMIDIMNNNSEYRFRYHVDLNDPDASTIEVSADDAMDYYALGLASHELMQKVLIIKK